MAYYLVGPVPLTSVSNVHPLECVFNSGSNRINNPVQNFVAISQFGYDIAENISDVSYLKRMGTLSST